MEIRCESVNSFQLAQVRIFVSGLAQTLFGIPSLLKQARMCLYRTCARHRVILFRLLRGMLRFIQKHILLFIMLYQKYAIIGSELKRSCQVSRFSLMQLENFTFISQIPDAKKNIFFRISRARHYCVSVTDIVVSGLTVPNMCVFLSFQTNETRFRRKHSPNGSTNT